MALCAIVLIATALAWLAAVAPGMRVALSSADDALYDAVYKLRPNLARPAVPIVLVEIDDASLKEAAYIGEGSLGQQWPWPRAMWGHLIGYFEKQGARCVVLDLHFTEPAVRGADDDEEFARALDAATVPVVISAGDQAWHFAPPVRRPVMLGDVGVTPQSHYRTYLLDTPRGPSLALAAVRAAGLPTHLPTDRPLRLQYHGHHRWGDGQSVYPALKASAVYFASFNPKDALPSDTFNGKIVVIGATAAGLGDLKTAPVGEHYPGVEVHATAIDNLINGDRVRVIPLGWRVLLSGLWALLAAGGIIFVRAASAKVAGIFIAAVLLVGAVVLPMLGAAPFWLPPTMPLLALVLATIAAMVFTYRVEDARARLLLKALGQCVSPHVAERLADDPAQLRVGGERREMTVLFSDIAGFTDLTERLGERIEPVLNFYLAEMSRQAFAADGTIDKYIGDAMMVFWNAPLAQADHAARACRLALAIVEHERRIAGRLGELGAAAIRTRIGINTGPTVVGFFGSSERLSYTAVGDAVNLAARLEPANKIYGTQVCVSRATRDAAGDGFVFRRLDRLRVYGRDEPAEVFELMADAAIAGEDVRDLGRCFDVAIGHYFAQNWRQAADELDAILARHPNDGPSGMLRSRVAAFARHPPASDWDGVFTAGGK